MHRSACTAFTTPDHHVVSLVSSCVSDADSLKFHECSHTLHSFTGRLFRAICPNPNPNPFPTSPPPPSPTTRYRIICSF